MKVFFKTNLFIWLSHFQTNRSWAQYRAQRPTRREVASTPCRLEQDGAGVTGRCARYCAHDRCPYYTVLPNPCSRNNAVCGVKFGLL